MVNTLSGSVCAYRKGTVKPRFIRIDELFLSSLKYYADYVNRLSGIYNSYL